MFRIKNYQFGFDSWGLVLFLVVMLPNLVWFLVPAVQDVLRSESKTPVVDAVASVFQVGMVAAQCFASNTARQKPAKRALVWGIGVLILLYYLGWGLYYLGNVDPAVILDLCATPCLAFVFLAMCRKNGAALIGAIGFSLCHIFYGVVNFIL